MTRQEKHSTFVSMSKPLDFAALRRRFEVLRVLSMVAFAVVCVTAIGLAYYLTK